MGSYTPSWLELEKSLGGRTVVKGTAAEMRAQLIELSAMLAPLQNPPSDAVYSKDGTAGDVRYRIYTPREASLKGPLPVGIYTHGGGWCMGGLDMEDAACRLVAEHGPSIIVSVDYRLAPEFKSPTQLEDTLTVFQWAQRNATLIGGDPAKFYSIGGSAGGALALATANHIAAEPTSDASVKGVVAMVPVTLHPDNVPDEYERLYTSYVENKDGVPVVDEEAMRQFFEYTSLDPGDERYFTALAKENHKKFPPTYIVTCEFDPLRDDGRVMAYALKSAGVPVRLDHYAGLPHYFWLFQSLPESQKFVENLIGGVKWVINQM